jgi:hypothetical protein
MVRRVAAVLLGTAAVTTAQPAAPSSVLERVAAYVEEYYSRAQSVLAEETIVFQPLARDLTADGFARRLVYELRFDWNPAPAPGEAPVTVARALVRASGPTIVPNEQECLAPPAISPEPLAFLLAEQREKYIFEAKGSRRFDGRDTLMFEFRLRAPEPPDVRWMGDCARVDLSGRKRGRIWVDPETAAVLRLDEGLLGPVDIPGPPGRPWRPHRFTFERNDASIFYSTVTFTNPDETLMLPSHIESVSVVQNAALSRLRITQSFANYRRFITESRLVR